MFAIAERKRSRICAIRTYAAPFAADAMQAETRREFAGISTER
jgi:hypothetical protein